MLRCEFCANPVPWDTYEYLSENMEYEKDYVYIVHLTCHDPDIVEVIEVCGELQLVRVAEPEVDE